MRAFRLVKDITGALAPGVVSNGNATIPREFPAGTFGERLAVGNRVDSAVLIFRIERKRVGRMNPVSPDPLKHQGERGVFVVE